jgi:hydroxymethylpyrimidine kinase/phosphomethylpyrimidine kinase
MKTILVIAGSDSCGGAGIQADIKTITGLGAHPLTALTAITAQNSLGVAAVHAVPARFVSKQVGTIVDDMAPYAVKIGMLYSAATVKEVARLVKRYKLPHVVVDPVLRASTGTRLLESEAVPILKETLIPFASVVTPNIYEAETLSGIRIDTLKHMAEAAEVIKTLGPDVVITGGHLKGRCVDLLYDGRNIHKFYDSRIATKHTHGSGCVFSTALATFLAEEKGVVEATKLAHDFARRAIMGGYACGSGAGPVQAGAISASARA